ITGEPITVKKDKDSHVVAGTVNQQGILYIQVSATGNDTVLAQIIRLVEEAQGSKLPIQTMVNQVTMWFVPVVIVLAVITFIA
ncbi:heavy metal translocating P-type ATPase, partial [Pseudomonas syringae]|uniref:P-type ATPase n=1 Tax=Pseudomonas syringae TaxID=317 RepID=UPI0034DAB1C9